MLAGFEIPGVLWRRERYGGRLPLVLDSPHSGAEYPDDFAYCCPLPVLRRAEDSYVDELYEAAPVLGATLIGAVFPRSYLDVNRAADDIDPGLLAGALPPFFRPRPITRVGLVRRHAQPGVPIYDRKLTADDILARLWPHLTQTQQTVLLYLLDGFSVEETAHHLGISHQAVTNTRRRIAHLALHLGISLHMLHKT